MNSKITGVYLGILGAIIISVLLYIDFSTERIYQDDPRFFADHPNAVPDHVLTGIKSIEEISLTRIVEVERETIFKIMADVNNYPYILPKNIISVEILEQDESTIIAEEEIIEQGIRAKLLVKHTFIPYEKQIIEILEGDAKGTKIEQATVVGKIIADNAKKAGIETVVFDRGGFLYHGRVKALAESARESGLKF